ncbi:hypothetical protein AB0B45_20275 [Nonomuraea sp. NPDC049152]|uniref:hypothetical protein n=1 Tax=Nonomuraea sp. NPDC049152 TaxID=3154350 RepID=UPI0033C3FD3F
MVAVHMTPSPGPHRGADAESFAHADMGAHRDPFDHPDQQVGRAIQERNEVSMPCSAQN